jgi:CRP-like cAMP-binding protein
MNKAIQDDGISMPIDEDDHFTQQRFYAGDVIYTEGMCSSHMYVIKEGEVDFYVIREEKRVVIRTLGKGQCFGMDSRLLNKGRATNASARTYCELYLIENDKLDEELHRLPKLMRGVLCTLAKQSAVDNELIATRINYQPDILIYAQLLYLLGIADIGKQKADAETNHSHSALAKPALSDVFISARVLFGHADVHIRESIGKLVMLHLVRIADENGNGKRVIFAPKDIMGQARMVSRSHKDHGRLDYEYINVDEFSALVDVDRATLLKKLGSSEFAQDIFTFRKSEIMRILNDKGRKFFSDRKIKSPQDFNDISDIEFADSKSIFDVISRCDIYDLAKLISTIEDDNIKDKIMACLSRSKREELESEISTLNQVDPTDVQQIGKSIILSIKERMIKPRFPI